MRKRAKSWSMTKSTILPRDSKKASILPFALIAKRGRFTEVKLKLPLPVTTSLSGKQEFPITLEGKTTMDIGASTGGFTDCMLQNGAVKVFAVDVGYGQFAWKLRQDERVVNMERTNIRYVTPEDIGEEIDFASVDVSFISLKLILPVAKTLLADNGEIVALIKPQFEAGREQVGKKGVVKDIKVHYEVIKKILDFARSIDLHVAGLSFSPIKGPEGNIEYLAYLKKAECEDNITDEKIQEIVDKSHNLL